MATQRNQYMNTLPELVKAFHYCCLFSFFSRNESTILIATRLGISARTVRRHKAMFNQGRYQCEHNAQCVRDRLALKRTSNSAGN